MADTTEEFYVSSLTSALETGLELVLQSQHGVQKRLLKSPQLSIGGPGSEWEVPHSSSPPNSWRFVYEAQRLHLVASSRKLAVQYTPQGSTLSKTVHFQQLQPGDVINFGDFQVEVARAAQPWGGLEGQSEPHRGQIWALQTTEPPTLIGRSPEGDQRILLQDPTVSRHHASIHWNDNQPRLIAHSRKSLTRVNNQTLQAGQSRLLQDGDLVWIGRQILTVFSSQANTVVSRLIVSVYSLGPLRVTIGDREIQDWQWQGPLVKYLLALLCLHRPHCLSEHRLTNELWGEQDVSKKRLYNMISLLRQLLRSDNCPDPILKETAGYRINPDLMLWHDLDELQELMGVLGTNPEVNTLNSKGFVEDSLRLLQLYSGPYLENSILGFAEIKRAELAMELTECLTNLARRFFESGDPVHSGRIAMKILEYDPLCGAAYLQLLESLTTAGKPHEVVRFYKVAKNRLQEVGLTTSSRLDLLYQQALKH